MSWRWLIVDEYGAVTGTDNASLAAYLASSNTVIDMQTGLRLVHPQDQDTSPYFVEEDIRQHIDPETRNFYE